MKGNIGVVCFCGSWFERFTRNRCYAVISPSCVQQSLLLRYDASNKQCGTYVRGVVVTKI